MSDAQDRANRRATPLLTSSVAVPVLSALGAGALYVVGVVNIAGALRAADLSAEEILPLLPLERHLAAGIGAVANVTTLATVCAYALVTWVVHGQLTRDVVDPGRQPSDTPKSRSDGDAVESGLLPARLWRWVMRHHETIAMAVLGTFCLVAFPRTAVIVATAIGAGWVATRAALRRGAPALTALLAYLVVVVAVLGLLEAFFRPEPLPAVEVRLTDNSRRIGDWIGINDGTLYMGQNGGLLGLPSREVRWSRVEHREREPEDSLLLELLGD